MLRRLIGALTAASVIMAAGGVANTIASPVVPSTKSGVACKRATDAYVSAMQKASRTTVSPSIYSNYVRSCGTQLTPRIFNLGYIDAPELYSWKSGAPVGIKSVTSSNPDVVAVGPGKSFVTTQGTKRIKTTIFTQYMIGIGKSTVCYTSTTKLKDCHTVVVPERIAGVPAVNNDNVWSAIEEKKRVLYFLGLDETSGITATSATSSDLTVVEVFNPDPDDPFVKNARVEAVRPGSSQVCVTFSTGKTACQWWDVIE